MKKKVLTLRNVLGLAGFDLTAKVKIVRHKDSRKSILIDGVEVEGVPYSWYRNDKEKFIAYQSEQHNDVFKDVDYIVSFIGEDGTSARFVGIYKIEGKDNVRAMKNGNGKFYYKMSEIEGYDEFKERIIIDWGRSTLSWHQWLSANNDKNIISVTPGFDWEVPDEYEDIILDHSHLKYIICDRAFESWHRKLSCCNCVYAITDSYSGKLYIGSTYNKEGIWGRWKDYAATVHGGDVELKKLLEKDPCYAKNFKWFILQILPLGVSDIRAIRTEKSWKERLGRSVCELNKN